MTTEKELQTLVELIDQAWQTLKLDDVKTQIEEGEKQMAAPDFWNDADAARVKTQEVAALKSQYDAWQGLRQDVQDGMEFLQLASDEGNTAAAKEIEDQVADFQKRYKSLESQLFFIDDMDVNDAIISVHAGAGGTDAMDWASMVMRMYLRFAQQQDWQVDMLDESRGEEAGYKRVTFLVRGRYAYGHLKNEAGVHRLVRISPFDAEKMRHTAFALVEVVPQLDNLSEKKVEVDEKDLRIDTFMSSGKGGQSVNTTYSAVRITHEPTGIVVSCQNERSQLQNKETALRVLKSRLFQKMLEERAETLSELKGGHTSPEWGNQIRSYVLHPYKMVKDHRTKEETQDVEAVLNGEVMPFIEAMLHQSAGERASVEAKD